MRSCSWAAAGGAAITAFYMFRLWFMTFAGEPRDHHIYDHAHESPKVMYVPLVVLAVFAVGVAWPIFGLTELAGTGPPARHAAATRTGCSTGLQLIIPTSTCRTPTSITGCTPRPASWPSARPLLGFLLAAVFYGLAHARARARCRRSSRRSTASSINKWYFDELYNALFVQPALFISRRVADFDRKVIDRFIDGCAGRHAAWRRSTT